MLTFVSSMAQLIPYAMASAALSMVITMALVFRKPREWIKARSKFLGELFSCPYCFSHWVSAVFVGIGDTGVGIQNPWLDLFITWLVLVLLSAPFSWVIYKSYSPMKIHGEDDEE